MGPLVARSGADVSPGIGERGNNAQSPSDGDMKRLGAAFILKARVSSHCAWFTKGARTGRNEMEVIGVNQRHINPGVRPATAALARGLVP